MKNKRVVLISFLGTLEPKEETVPNENYWKLIGEKGEIIDDQKIHDGRVLVRFDNNLDVYGLENHNPIKDSLWIKKSDLRFEGKDSA